MIDPEVMLEYYKEQSTVEREFRFIKDGRFHVSEVYLENENRIAALAMIMVLCLMVYSITEWQFRNTLQMSVNGGIKMPKCGRIKVYTSPHKNIEIYPGSECVNTPCFLRSLSR